MKFKFSPTKQIFFCITLIALGLRTWQLSSISPGFSGHGVAQFELDKIFLSGSLSWQELVRLILTTETGPIALIQASWYRVVGVSIFTMRLLPAIVGAFSIGWAYLMGAKLFDNRFGLLFSTLLTSSIWHLSFSRYENLEHIMPVLLTCVIGWLATKVARQPNQLSHYIFLGILTGSTIYFYAATQILLLLMPGLIISLVLTKTKKPSRLKAVGLYFISLTIVVLPQLVTYFHWGHFVPVRKIDFNQNLYPLTSLEEIPTHVQSALSELLISHTDAWVGGAGPILIPFDRLLLLVGVSGWLWRRRFDPRVKQLDWVGLLFVLGLLPGVMGPTSVPFRRMVLAGIAQLLFETYALWLVLNLLTSRLHANHVKLTLIGLCVCLGTIFSSRYFDGPFTSESMGMLPLRMMAEATLNQPGQKKVVLDSASAADNFQRLVSIIDYPALTKQRDLINILVWDGSQSQNDDFQCTDEWTIVPTSVWLKIEPNAKDCIVSEQIYSAARNENVAVVAAIDR